VLREITLYTERREGLLAKEQSSKKEGGRLLSRREGIRGLVYFPGEEYERRGRISSKKGRSGVIEAFVSSPSRERTNEGESNRHRKVSKSGKEVCYTRTHRIVDHSRRGKTLYAAEGRESGRMLIDVEEKFFPTFSGEGLLAFAREEEGEEVIIGRIKHHASAGRRVGGIKRESAFFWARGGKTAFRGGESPELSYTNLSSCWKGGKENVCRRLPKRSSD